MTAPAARSRTRVTRFPEAGYYLVLLDVHDLKGQSDRQSLLLGSWPPKQWAKAQSGQAPPLTKERAVRIQAVQQARTRQAPDGDAPEDPRCGEEEGPAGRPERAGTALRTAGFLGPQL